MYTGKGFLSFTAIKKWDASSENWACRPSYDIPYDLLVNFLEAGFMQKEIASIIGVSYKTVSRRIEQFGMAYLKFSQISDLELVTVVKDIIKRYPKKCDMRIGIKHRPNGKTFIEMQTRIF